MKPLSATEVEVLQELADGLGTAEIAASRRSSAQLTRTTRIERARSFGADNRAHLIAVAFRAGIMK